MKTTDSAKDILEGIDLDSIIKTSVRSSLSEELRTRDLKEAYVAQPKSYPQVTEVLSQKAKNAHTELYKHAVEELNRVSAALDTADRAGADSNHSEYRSLKLDETFNLNSVWLHELFFANCCDPQSTVYMDGIAFLKLQEAWGDFNTFQEDFIACAMSCGNGWAVTGYNIFLRRYVNTIISNHSQDVMVGLYPLIVLDVHEHARFRDYLTDRKSFIVAMMRELNWDVINERFNKAEAIKALFK